MTLRPLEASLFEKLSDEVKELMLASGVVPVADPLMQLWQLPEGTRTVVLIGGRGGMKTYGVSDFIANQAAVNKKRCAVLRDEKSRIKETILNEILLRFDSIKFRTDVERLETGIKDKKTNEAIVFTMGFKASDNTKTANLKGVSNIDIAVVEEAEDIRDVTKFNNFTDGLRKEGCLVIIILNTPDIGHWILKRYFNTTKPVIPPPGTPADIQKEYDGYYQLEPKGTPGVVCIITGYEQNKWIPQSKVEEYEAYGDPSSDRYDLHHYLTAIKGYASTGRKGQVHKKVKKITLKEYLALPYKEYYGQDFGTAAPAGLVGVKIHRNTSWCRQLNYKPMNELSIAKKYCELKLTPADLIVADYADKKAIRKLSDGFSPGELSPEDLKNYPRLVSGFNVVKCLKGPDSVSYGLSVMNRMELFAVEESTDLWNEILNRVYGQDKSGEYTNDPEPGFDHLIDPWMYVITYFERGSGGGISSG